MPVDPEKGVVTDLMLGLMVVVGLDLIVLAGFGWVAGVVSSTVFAAVTVVIVASFAAWIAWRWRAIRTLQASEKTPVEALKYQYATGELSEAEFERRLDRLVETETETVDQPPTRTDHSSSATDQPPTETVDAPDGRTNTTTDRTE